MNINDTDGRVCTKCEQWKPYSEFYQVKKPKGMIYRGQCKTCCNAASMRNYYDNHDARKATQRARVNKSRDAVYAAYGAACNCCGEIIPEFLTIDHVNNDGAEHRRTKLRKNGTAGLSNTYLYAQIIAENFPDKYQLLCMNCNLGRERNGGVCPHVNPQSS